MKGHVSLRANGMSEAISREIASPRKSGARDDGSSLAGLVRELLLRLGEDPDREGLARTPERVERSLKFLTQGYDEDIEKLFARARFSEPYDEMVLVKDIDFFSLCEHHLIPFFGKCHVAYIPDGKIVGLSKIPRLVDALSHRLQVQ